MLYVLIFALGLALGSFLNVVICRLETDESIFFSRSKCPHCGKALKWYELIPFLSFIIQFGKCRSCGKKISWQYPSVEISTGFIFLLIFNFQFLNLNFENLKFLNLVYLLIIISSLLVIFVYDLKYYIIPDKIVFPAIGISVIYLIFNSFFVDSYALFINNLFSAIGASGFFLFLVLITKGKGMGLGDVKLAFLMGLVLGWPGVFLAIFMAVMVGAVFGLFLMLIGRKKIKSQIPFGPFLSGATIFFIIFGDFVIDYFNNFNFIFLNFI